MRWIEGVRKMVPSSNNTSRVDLRQRKATVALFAL
jgi:hypothetical protein